MKYILSFTLMLLAQFSFSQNWNFHSSFSKGSSIIDITVGQAGTVYALTSGRDIYYSTNHGDTWTGFVDVPAFFNVDDIEASTTTNRLFALTNCCGVAYTDDFGTGWTWDNLEVNTNTGFGLSPTGLGVLGTKVLAMAPNFNVVPHREELYKSNNNGANGSWNLVYTFTGGDGHVKDVFYFADNLIFASFSPLTSADKSLRKSTDGALSFSSVPLFDGKEIAELLLTPSQVIYCAANSDINGDIYKSTDQGTSWNAIAPFSDDAKIISIAYDDSNDLLYAITVDGIYRKIGSEAWINILPQSDIEVLSIAANKDILAGGVKTLGIKKSASNPVNFVNRELGGDTTPDWMAISDKTILTGSISNPAIFGMNTDNPDQWQYIDMQSEVNTGHLAISINADVKNNGHIVVGGFNYIADIDVTDLTVNILADHTTAPLTPPAFTRLYPEQLKLSNNDALLIKQGSSANYIDFSPDGGTFWGAQLDPVQGQETTILKDFCAGTNLYYALTFDFSIVFGYQLHYSADAQNWNTIALPASTTGNAIFVDKTDNLYLLATGPLALYRLDMPMMQWVATSLDLDNDPNTYFELKFDSNNRMYALNYKSTTPSSLTQGIAYSDDQGESWVNISLPVENGTLVYLDDMGFDGDDVLYAKTSDNNPLAEKGIYYYADLVSTVSGITASSINIYPNPVQDYFNVEVEGAGSFLIHDLWGREMASGTINKENNTIKFPENSPAGAYVFSLKTSKTYFSRVLIKSE